MSEIMQSSNYFCSSSQRVGIARMMFVGQCVRKGTLVPILASVSKRNSLSIMWVCTMSSSLLHSSKLKLISNQIKLGVRTRSDISGFQLLRRNRGSSGVAGHCCTDILPCITLSRLELLFDTSQCEMEAGI